jgi:Kef-type K+ transport system membrane component KefB
MFVGLILLMSYFAEASGVHRAVSALLACSFSQMPKKDYEKSIEGLHSIAHGVFIPIFFASISIHFSYGCLSVPYYLVPVVLVIITFGKFGGAILAAAIAKLKPLLTIGTGVMAKGAVDLVKMLSLLSAGMVQPDLFSLVVFRRMIMILVTSATLKRGICLPLLPQARLSKR